jgi:hypothetical protein
MDRPTLSELSPCGIEQTLRCGKLSEKQSNKYRKRLCYLRKDARETIENWSNNPAIRASCRTLHRQKKFRPVYKEGVLVGYEYDLLEAVWVRIRKVQRDEKMYGNKNNKEGFKAAISAKKNRKIRQMAGR